MAHDHRHDDHGHAHGPGGHAHAPVDFGRAFAIGIALNIAFVAVEAGFGLWSNSVALLADAGHNLSDVAGLVVAWVASALGRRKPTPRFTYGWKSASILAALINALLLLVAIAAIVWEAVQRLQHPEPVATATVMAVAAVGILVNGATAWLFASGRKDDLNVRGAFVHMAADALVSLAVVIAGAMIWATGALWLDPAVSLIVAGVIFWSTWGLLRDSLALALAGAPAHVDMAGVRGYLAGLPGVADVHDLHVWAMSTTETALSAHVVMPAGHPGDAMLREIAAELAHDFRIRHITIQVEIDAEGACPLHSHAAR